MTRRPEDASALLGEAEVQRLLLAASERAPSGVRNRALVALLYCSGLRLAEALALVPADVELDVELHVALDVALDVALGAGRVLVRGRRAREAHLFAAARPYLEAWLAVRAGLAPPARAALFCTLSGAPLEPSYVRAMLARLGRRAGLGKRVHAHLLRHSCAARLGRAGLAADALAEQLGQTRARSARRALAPFGVALAGAARRASELPWSLAPEPGSVRARVALRGAKPAARAESAAPAAGSERAPGGVVVRRWRPQQL